MTGLLRLRRTALGVALACMILTAQVVVGATAAHARCDGVGREVTSTLGASTAFVVERPTVGTCNGNNLYQGTVRAALGPDRIGMVSVFIQNGGKWTQVQFTNSRTGSPVKFTDNNSHTFMTLCWYEPAPSIGTAHCGWGSTYGPVGTTPTTRPDIYNQSGYHGVNFGF
jgi:hypothetical protein